MSREENVIKLLAKLKLYRDKQLVFPHPDETNCNELTNKIKDCTV